MPMPCRHVGRETTADTFFPDEADQPVKETWKFSRWTLPVWISFAEWARTILPDPIERAFASLHKIELAETECLRKVQIADAEEYARVVKLNQEEIAKARIENREPVLKPYIAMAPQRADNAGALVKAATDKASSYLEFESPEIRSLLGSVVGTTKIFQLLLLKYHPDMTDDLAYAIYQSQSPLEVGRILRTVRGIVDELPKNALAPVA